MVRAAELSAALSSGAAFVDGVLYLPSTGPVWEYGIRRDGFFGAHAKPEASRFRADALMEMYPGAGADTLEAFGRAFAPGYDVRMSGGIEILEPGLPWHPDEILLRALAADFVDTAKRRGIKEMRAPELRAVASLMEFVDAPLGFPDPHSVFPALVAYSGFVAALHPEGPARHWMPETVGAGRMKMEARGVAAAPGPPGP